MAMLNHESIYSYRGDVPSFAKLSRHCKIKWTKLVLKHAFLMVSSLERTWLKGAPDLFKCCWYIPGHCSQKLLKCFGQGYCVEVASPRHCIFVMTGFSVSFRTLGEFTAMAPSSPCTGGWANHSGHTKKMIEVRAGQLNRHIRPEFHSIYKPQSSLATVLECIALRRQCKLSLWILRLLRWQLVNIGKKYDSWPPYYHNCSEKTKI